MRKSGVELVIFACLLLILNISGCSTKTNPEKRSVILISIDTMRADHLRCYGYDRKTSPTMDSLALAGTRWTSCQAQSPWTLPSHASIWTGLSVDAHGTRWDECGMHVLVPYLPSLPKILNDEGFKTAAFTNVAYLSPDYGFDRGFDEFTWHPNGAGRARTTIDNALQWILHNADKDEPFFLLLHFFDVHAPYAPPAPPERFFEDVDVLEDSITWSDIKGDSSTAFRQENLNGLIDLYDAEIRCIDEQLNRLMAQLRYMEIDDNTLIIIVSDHGEEFMDHGSWGHGHTLYQELLEVPLIMTGPDVPSGIVDSTVVGHFDILPTILDYLDIDIPENIEGMNILGGQIRENRGVPSGGATPVRHLELSSKGDSIIVSADNQLHCVRIGEKKIYWILQGDSIRSYNLLTDPLELEPQEDTLLCLEMIEEFVNIPLQAHPAYVVITDTTINEALEGLGYIR